jgi:hypothetical protein
VFVAAAVAVEVFTCVAPAAGVASTAAVVVDTVAGAVAGVGVLDAACGTQMLINVPSSPEPFGSGAFGSMVTETFPFVDEVCLDVAGAFDVCVVGAVWSTACDCPPDPLPSPVWAWSEPCFTAFEFAAPAVAPELLVCVTGPSSPGLLFRTTMLVFVGLTWFEVAVAFESCVTGALCVDV